MQTNLQQTNLRFLAAMQCALGGKHLAARRVVRLPHCVYGERNAADNTVLLYDCSAVGISPGVLHTKRKNLEYSLATSLRISAQPYRGKVVARVEFLDAPKKPKLI